LVIATPPGCNAPELAVNVTVCPAIPLLEALLTKTVIAIVPVADGNVLADAINSIKPGVTVSDTTVVVVVTTVVVVDVPVDVPPLPLTVPGLPPPPPQATNAVANKIAKACFKICIFLFLIPEFNVYVLSGSTGGCPVRYHFWCDEHQHFSLAAAACA
jgi:hypothetical protein